MRKIMLLIICLSLLSIGGTALAQESQCEKDAKLEWMIRWNWCNGENDLSNKLGPPPRTIDESRKCKKEIQLLYDKAKLKCKEDEKKNQADQKKKALPPCAEDINIKTNIALGKCGHLKPIDEAVCHDNAVTNHRHKWLECTGENLWKKDFGTKANCKRVAKLSLKNCRNRCEKYSGKDYYKRCISDCETFNDNLLSGCDTIK
jgi:hypothetical protein